MNKNTRILLTGVAGFMGSCIAHELVNQGFVNIYGIDNLSGGFLRNVPEGVNFYAVDLADPNLTKEVIEEVKPEIVFHLAASAREGASQFQPRLILQTNYQAFINLLVPCIEHDMKKIINFSSMSVYGDQKPPFDEENPRSPVDIYGINKAAMEHSTEILSNIYGFKYTIIRPHNVIGIRQCLSDRMRNVCAIFMNRILRKEPLIIYGDGHQLRAFSGIDYSLPCYIKAMEEADGEIINIGGKVPMSVNELAMLVLEAMGEGLFYPIKHIDDRPLEVKHAWSTFSKSEKLLGYSEPKEGVRETVFKMADWAKTLGPQEWSTEPLELTNHLTPKTWLENFNPHNL